MALLYKRYIYIWKAFIYERVFIHTYIQEATQQEATLQEWHSFTKDLESIYIWACIYINAFHIYIWKAYIYERVFTYTYKSPEKPCKSDIYVSFVKECHSCRAFQHKRAMQTPYIHVYIYIYVYCTRVPFLVGLFNARELLKHHMYIYLYTYIYTYIYISFVKNAIFVGLFNTRWLSCVDLFWNTWFSCVKTHYFCSAPNCVGLFWRKRAIKTRKRALFL